MRLSKWDPLRKILATSFSGQWPVDGHHSGLAVGCGHRSNSKDQRVRLNVQGDSRKRKVQLMEFDYLHCMLKLEETAILNPPLVKLESRGCTGNNTKKRVSVTSKDVSEVKSLQTGFLQTWHFLSTNTGRGLLSR